MYLYILPKYIIKIKSTFHRRFIKMSTELLDAPSCSPEVARLASQESEFDDALEVPDSLEITIDENGETIQVYEKETEDVGNKGI